MKAEVHGVEDPDTLLATVTWSAGKVAVDCQDPVLSKLLGNVFRSTPVMVDDASYRRLGTHGEVVVQPGNLEWFRAVVQQRLPAETELVGRLVPEIKQGGFDPAAGYRSFESTLERLAST